MKRLPVVSNAFRSIGYDPEAGRIELEFKNGRLYHGPVPHRLYQRLLNAASHGDFFHENIRPYYKLQELRPDRNSIAVDEEQGTLE